MNKPLYETDFYRWSGEQAEALRQAGASRINTPAPIDWENVAEEIDSLGRSQRTELRSRLCVILEHLLKLTASPSSAPRRGWEDTIAVQREEIGRLLDDSPSLRREVPDLITVEAPRARRIMVRAAERHGETLLQPVEEISFTPAQVLEDWYPQRV